MIRRMSLVSAIVCCASVHAQDRSLEGNPELAAWFEDEVSQIERDANLQNFETLTQWEAKRPELRRQLFDMLGLDPLPQRTDLNPQITGGLEQDDIIVENLHFQASPGLYVTGNLYRPKEITKPLPAVLYVCGHAGVKKDGVSFGNKTHYHHHGCWFARNGYVCLTIDTLQLGEIEAIHHGTYRYGRWWWNARGYTPSGVEAWFCIRALDYLQSRPEVDGDRLGVTGRSGGGIDSWWIAALDDRIKCAVPVAGITSLRNHVMDGCVEGHCDCMYMVNTYRWDFPLVAALVAPRALLISNSDKDGIFPLDGVLDVHHQVAHVYDLYRKSDHLGLNITEGPHKDTQELRVHAFRWLNRWLKDDTESLIDKNAVKFFEPEQLRVLADTPTDEVNTRIDEIFVPAAEKLLQPPDSDDDLLAKLKRKCFAAWPDLPAAKVTDDGVTQDVKTTVVTVDEARVDVTEHDITFNSQPHVPLTLNIQSGNDLQLNNVKHITLIVSETLPPDTDDKSVSADVQLRLSVDSIGDKIAAVAFFNPRGTGSSAFQGNEKKQVQIRRRYQLVGTTLESMQVWDIRRAIQMCRSACGQDVAITVRPTKQLVAETVCAVLYEPPVRKLIPPENLAGFSADDVNIFNLTKTVNIRDLFDVDAP
jgi:dienelactone hydrolase